MGGRTRKLPGDAPARHRKRGRAGTHGHAHTHTGTRTRFSWHTRTSDVTTVNRRESPSLPLHRDCLFRRGGLVARRRLELQRVLGGRGDRAGPRRRTAAEHRGHTDWTPAAVARPRPHSPSDPRPPSRPSLLEVPADPEDGNGEKPRSARRCPARTAPLAPTPRHGGRARASARCF